MWCLYAIRLFSCSGQSFVCSTNQGFTVACESTESYSAGLGQWLSGSSCSVGPGQAPVPRPQQSNESAALTILYGSQTGNAKAVATKVKVTAEQQGIAAKLTDTASYKTTQLAKEKYLLIVTSTYGEGEPPESAVAFHKFFVQQKSPENGWP